METERAAVKFYAVVFSDDIPFAVFALATLEGFDSVVMKALKEGVYTG